VQLLVTFQNKVTDFCFARKTEKDELLKDLTSNLSKVDAPTPHIPAHHTEPTPPTSAPPPAANPHLPYPMQHQGMPIPYAPPGAAPYPMAYAPMPTGYNPYALPPSPYPQQHAASYSYPYPPPQTGYPQQQGGFPGYPGYPPQQPPPNQQQPPW